MTWLNTFIIIMSLRYVFVLTICTLLLLELKWHWLLSYNKFCNSSSHFCMSMGNNMVTLYCYDLIAYLITCFLRNKGYNTILYCFPLTQNNSCNIHCTSTKSCGKCFLWYNFPTSRSSISFIISAISFPPKSSISLRSFCSHVPRRSSTNSSDVGDSCACGTCPLGCE